MAEVHLPVVGGVSKKALMIGGAAAAGVVGLIYIRKRKTAATTPAAGTGTTGTDTTGSGDYVDPGLQDTSGGPVYGATGYTDPNTGQWVYGNTGTGQASATTNTAWAQNAIAFLGSNVSVDSALLSAALGAYLNGQPLTAEQIGLVDQAIAVEGYPPTSGTGGYPPGIREAGTASQGGTGGSGGGVTGGGGGKAAGAISGLRITGYNKTGVSFAWNAATGATQGYAWRLTGNGISKTGKTSNTHVSVTGLTKPGVYNFGIQALPGGAGDNIHTPSLKG